MLEDTDLTDFMNKNRPTGKRSKLDAYCEQIATLKKSGYSAKDIHRFLKDKKNVEVSLSNLNTYIKNRCLIGTANNKTAKKTTKSSLVIKKTNESRQPEKTVSNRSQTTTFVMNRTPLSELIK